MMDGGTENDQGREIRAGQGQESSAALRAD